ncbi:gas vesicle protein GvpL/GvpF [Stackebrandtia endophytica]|uniref:Gas vesicle protein GvpL/GvpF n=1 Tax=Stackebrandtia endophytica TaxID=1496996 RepID=A0A543B1V9_9ACTN|nr:GvpL/GvpF family gas vesicle protein [Stackebrandtia endophytica]TQL78819.1 gas vesicle protein GvpL/GvpF [Stackebrandtia endophytica]
MNDVVYVYGIVPDQGRLPDDTAGVGEPPATVSLIRHGAVSAVTSVMDADRPLGLPEDLRAHFTVLNDTAELGPVLPLRFGAVLPDEQTVVDKLLAPHHDAFVESLDELDGYGQYLVKGRYTQDDILREIIADNPEAARLCEEINRLPADETHDQRVALGELTHVCLEALRDQDTKLLLTTVDPWIAAAELRDAGTEQHAFHIALLATSENGVNLERAITEIADEWQGRVGLQLIGPMAPYDFVLAPDT